MPAEAVVQFESAADIMARMGRAARDAATIMATVDTATKNLALRWAATALRDRAGDVLAANHLDLAAAEDKDLSAAMIDRLKLTEERLDAVARGVEEVAALPDPVGDVMAAWERPNGLRISRVRTPLGVIGVIFESRPNVTADAGSLCLKAGNAAILRSGSESFHSSRAIMACLADGLAESALPAAAIQLVPTTDRACVGAMLTLTEDIDVIVPRGGRSLIERVSRESRVPLFKHLEGICHTYVHGAADREKARRIVVNAKMRRTGICGATETVLVDRTIASAVLPTILDDLIAAGCEVRGDDTVCRLDERVIPAVAADWDTEYLDAILSIRVVDDLEEAIAHIRQHSSEHTEAIVTEDEAVADRFLQALDSAIVMVNTSTQFADGGEFGMGAEIGIATGKLHARGPVGVEQLTSFKYVVHGDGQCRP